MNTGTALAILNNHQSTEAELLEAHQNLGHNPFNDIDSLPLSPIQKVCVLEWFAQKLVHIDLEVTGNMSCSQPYDPLLIDLPKKTAHSYAFDLTTGGRHHPFETLKEIEDSLVEETIRNLKADNLSS
jgi:hypothetical protein